MAIQDERRSDRLIVDLTVDPPEVTDLDDGLRHRRVAVAEVLAGTPLFEAVPPDLLARVAAAARAVHLPAGEWLFRQGEPAGDLFVVASGRLEVLRETRDTATQIRLLARGAVVGELAMLTESTRSASVRAIRDSELFGIDPDTFSALITETPQLALSLIRQLASLLRVSGGVPTPELGPAVITVLGDRGLPVAEVAEDLAPALGSPGSVAVATRPDGSGRAEFGRYLDSLEASYRRVLLVGDGRSAEWDDFCMRQADRVLVLARPGTTPPAVAWPPDCHVAFVGPTATSGQRRPWLNRLAPVSHHHVPNGRLSPPLAGRIARRLLGQSCGIVLSGGGARGLAHIGALEVLLDSGVKFDRVGGCSMGAFIGGMFAMGMTPDEITRVCRRELVDQKPFSDYTFPRVSILRAARAEEMLQRVFGNIHIEELPTDYFSLSCDLVSAQPVVHRRGLLWEAVGTSMSIPGLVPPVRREERILVDGGLLDNMPVDVMAAEPGPIVAIDVMGEGWEPRTVGGDPRPIPAGWRQRIKHLMGHGSEALPTIAETLARTTVIGSFRLAEVNRGMATVLIQPAVGTTGVLEFKRIDEMLSVGRRAAAEAVQLGVLPVTV